MTQSPRPPIFRWHGRPVFVMYCRGYCAIEATTDWTGCFMCLNHPTAAVHAETCFEGDHTEIEPGRIEVNSMRCNKIGA